MLLACYELGHQPLSLAWPLAVLSPAGFPTTARDLSVTALDPAEVAQASLVAIAVPMHTALRLGVAAAQQVRAINPQATIMMNIVAAHRVATRQHPNTITTVKSNLIG